MTYYFPLGITDGITKQNIGFAASTTTSSAAQAQTTLVLTASYALTSGSVPVNGAAGISKTEVDCPERAPIGPTGPAGTRGANGTNNTTCPEGTVECTGLFTSLSLFINPNVPSGSQYSKVCMQIPAGCALINVVCPDTLPIAYPAIIDNT